MKIKTSELSGSALDWAVATILGDPIANGLTDDERYSTNWAQGGPIIEREFVTIEAKGVHPYWWARMAYENEEGREQWSEESGPTPLIAAMRCFVASKLGKKVDVPEELK